MRSTLPLLAIAAPLTTAIQIQIDDPDSIKAAASTAAWGLANLYTGNQTGQAPGTLLPPYYWWECGAMFGALINYWYYTGDDTYNDLVSTGLQFQTGDDADFMPTNQTRDEGNDDQIFWGFAVMEAAEYGFPNPPSTSPQWLELAQGVFNSQANRWNNATCNGGLRWQIFEFNDGYGYKNAPSNAGFANLASRLYAYTGNKTYADWVEASWGWMEGVGMIAADGNVWDGTSVGNNCTTLNHIPWSYSSGMIINAAATMWNVTQDDLWQTRMMTVWNTASTTYFNSDKVMIEPSCTLEQGGCDTDEWSFKAYLARFLAASAKIAPFFWDDVKEYLQQSAVAAAAQCDGTGQDGNTQACGFAWQNGATWDGTTGVGQQMSALEAIQVNLLPEARFPVTAAKGGNSTGDPSAGSNGDTSADPALPQTPITTGQRAGAGILTALVVVGMVGGSVWLLQ